MKIVFLYVNSKQRKINKIHEEFMEGIRKISGRTRQQFYDECEETAKFINADKRLKKVVVAILGFLFFLQDSFVYAEGLDGLDRGGMKILQVVHKIGYWVLLPNAALGLMRWALQQDPKGKKQCLGSIAALAGLYGLKPIFDFIVSLF